MSLENAFSDLEVIVKTILLQGSAKDMMDVSRKLSLESNSLLEIAPKNLILRVFLEINITAWFVCSIDFAIIEHRFIAATKVHVPKKIC